MTAPTEPTKTELLALTEALNVRRFPTNVSDRFRAGRERSAAYLVRRIKEGTLRPYQTVHALRILHFLRRCVDRQEYLDLLCSVSRSPRAVVRIAAADYLRYVLEGGAWDGDWELEEDERERLHRSLLRAVHKG